MPPHFPSTFTPFDIPVPLDPFSPTNNHTLTIHGLTSPSNGPPLLCLHGFPQTQAIYRKVTPVLSTHFQLILLDLRCYGQSGTLPADDLTGHRANDHHLMKKSVMVRDCVSVLSSLGIIDWASSIQSPNSQQPLTQGGEVFVLAHDRGARVAHRLAIDFPQLVKAQILLDICPTKAMYEKTDLRFARAYWHWFFLIQPSPIPEDMILGSPDTIVRRQIPDAEKRGSMFGEAEEEYVRQMRERERVHGMCEDYRASADEDLQEHGRDEEEGRKVRCRTRVLWGREGVIERLFDARREWGRVIEEGMFDEKGSGTVESGHYIPEERPEDVIKHCLEFFLGIDQRVDSPS
ncbi:MAG: hypothetical protein M1831_006781 [Alyxoria varia]|nr:MAG: hypothetical protein M1831_006781 [Alyxoria varia]